MRLLRDLQNQTDFWSVIATTDRTQIATMVLEKNQESGPYGTEHPESDQVIYVARGSGTILANGQEHEVQAGDVAIIPAGMEHQVRGGPIVTLNVYTPPAYDPEIED